TTSAFDNLINFRSHMKHFVRGFEYYINITRSPAWLHHHILAEEVNQRLLPWLEHHTDENFFAFVHYWDPHTPYNLPEKFRGRFSQKNHDLVVKSAKDGYDYVPGWGPINQLPEGNDELSIDLYDDEIFYTDYCIGQVRQKLEELNLLDNTVIIVTSDHGEDLDLHGIWGHGTVHETTIKVPLIIRDPSYSRNGSSIPAFVQHADNLPTILRYFPTQDRPRFTRVTNTRSMPEIPSEFDGRDLMEPDWFRSEPRSKIVVESGSHRALLSPPWKLIWHKDGTGYELFNLQNDPLELNDRTQQEIIIADQLKLHLHKWVEKNLKDNQSDPIYASDGAWTCFIGDKSPT
ncbi:MAG: sulfatase-like hydrolase/transferase, partial [Anaerolineae bacterium]|nr:sulfatase-like hydrolase/transferase [Anaerolineae bacterium]